MRASFVGFWTLIVVFLSQYTTQAQQPIKFYVSKIGRDTNPGTIQKPLYTLNISQPVEIKLITNNSNVKIFNFTLKHDWVLLNYKCLLGTYKQK